MKKRKELDALVANGKLGRNVRKTKKGQHELLRSETDSSEIEEFSILTPRKNSLRKAGPSRICSAFVPVCVFILVAACGVCSGALIWMHFNLRTDLDVVREHLQKVESSNKGLPEEFHSIDTRIKDLEANHSALVTELSKLNTKVKSIIRQIGLLNQTTGNLQQSIAAAPEIKALPNDVKTLLMNYASMGSDMKELQNTVEELKDKHKSYDNDKDRLNNNLKFLQDEMGDIKTHFDLLTNPPVTTNPFPTSLINIVPPTNMAIQTVLTNYIHEEVNRFSSSLDSLNSTFTLKIQHLTNDMYQHHIEIAELRNSSSLTQSRVSQLESDSPSSSSLDKLKLKLEEFVQQVVENRFDNDSLEVTPSMLLVLQNMSQNVKILKDQYDKIKLDENNPFTGINGSIYVQNYINKTLNEAYKDHLKTIESLKEVVEHMQNAFATTSNQQVEMETQINTILQILDKINNHFLTNNDNLNTTLNMGKSEESELEFVPAHSVFPLFEADDNKPSTTDSSQSSLATSDGGDLDLVASTVGHGHPEAATSSVPSKSHKNSIRSSSSQLLESLVKKFSK